MKIMSPALWLKLHVAFLMDGITAAGVYWHTNPKAVKFWIICNVVMLGALWMMFQLFSGSQGAPQ